MKRLTRYRLESNKAVSYFLDYLNDGSNFGDFIRKHVNFRDGIFFVDLPEESHVNRIYQFDLGGMTPLIDLGAEKEKNAQGGDFIPRFFMCTDREQCQFIKNFMCTNQNNFALFNELLNQLGDKRHKIPNIRSEYQNDEIFYVLSPKNSIDEIYETFRSVCTAWRSIFLLMSGDLKSSDQFLDDNQNIILQNLKYVVIGAYDGEASIVWEKNQFNTKGCIPKS